MITGRQALASIEQAITDVRRDESQLDATLRSASDEAARLRGERASLFKELARVKLDIFQQEDVTQVLDSAERRAMELIRRQSEARRERGEERSRLIAAVEAAQNERHRRAQALEEALDAFEAARAAAEPKMRASEAWQAQRKRLEDAKEIAQQARRKAEVAQADLAEKRRPYEGDPLFMYLWNRKFGTAEDRSSFFARFFDRMVARLVGYSGARANYAMLQEIPARLSAHASAREADIGVQEEALARVESEGLREHGAGAAMDELARARAALIGAEEALATQRARLSQLDEADEADRNDDNYAAAVALMAEADSRQDIRDLYREAAQTKSPEDEAIVRRIEGVDSAIARAEQEVADIRQQARQLAQRRMEIEKERDAFRQQGYDAPGSTFGNESLLGQVIKGLITGAIQGAVLRDTLRQGHHRSRRDPGPIFPLPGDSWGSPGGGGPWGGGGGGGGGLPPWLGGGGGGGGGRSSGGSSSGGGSDRFTTGGSF
jgi:chromosome segregation ATPase